MPLSRRLGYIVMLNVLALVALASAALSLFWIRPYSPLLAVASVPFAASFDVVLTGLGTYFVRPHLVRLRSNPIAGIFLWIIERTDVRWRAAAIIGAVLRTQMPAAEAPLPTLQNDACSGS